MRPFKVYDLVTVEGYKGIAVILRIKPATNQYEIRFEADKLDDTYWINGEALELFPGVQNSPYKEGKYKLEDAVEKMMNNSSYGMYGSVANTCNHHFVRYTGLRETFLFCKICDLKKEN